METIVEILIDYSTSMGACEHTGVVQREKYLLADGRPKMKLVKQLLIKNVVPSLYNVSSIRIEAFHSDNDKKLVTIPVFAKSFDKDLLLASVEKLPIPEKTGGTPITAAIKKAIVRLSKHSNSDIKIILLTDGEETGKEDYSKAAIETMQLHNISSCEVFVIGIELNDTAKDKAISLANATNGEYINVSKPITNEFDAFKAKLKLDTFSKTRKIINTELQQHLIAIDQITKSLINLQQVIGDLKTNTLSPYTNHKDGEIIRDGWTSEKNEEFKKMVGDASEKYVNSYLEKELRQSKNTHIWMNKYNESRKSYDFEVRDKETEHFHYYIECKGTVHSERIFYLTKGEWQLLISNPKIYKIYLVTNALSEKPKLEIIENLLAEIKRGKAVPYSSSKVNLDEDRIVMTILD